MKLLTDEQKIKEYNILSKKLDDFNVPKQLEFHDGISDLSLLGRVFLLSSNKELTNKFVEECEDEFY